MHLAVDNRRVLVFDPNGTFVRESRFVESGSLSGDPRTVHWILPLARGRTLLNVHSTHPQSFGIPFALVDIRGQTIARFGAPNLNPRQQGASARVMAPATDSTLWVSEIQNYVLEEVTLSGNKVRSLAVLAPWFDRAPWTTPEEGRRAAAATPMIRVVRRPGERPTRLLERYGPSIRDLQVDDNGLLWVLWQRGKADWKEQELEYVPLRDESILTMAMNDRLYMSMIDILDPVAGKVLARTELQFHSHIAGKRLLAHPFVDGDGLVRVELLSLSLHRPPVRKEPS
ncbi:MAG: hypothetical protein ACT4OZ_04830 [Gemmatimonadota bacterium]